MGRWRSLAVAVAGLLAACDTGSGEGEAYRVVTDDARGLRPGAAVYVAGVEVGEVRGVSLDEGGYATITFGFDDRAGAPPAISGETCASVASFGLGGPQHLALTPGRRGDPPLRGRTITCVEEGGADPMLRSASKIFDEIAAGRGTLGRLVRDPEVADALVRFLDGACAPCAEGEPAAASPPGPDAPPAATKQAPPAATKQASPEPRPRPRPRPATPRSQGESTQQMLSPWLE
jgi:hypothetical protein